MSVFAGTPLEMALRDLGIRAFAIAGVALEIGIAPTVWHAVATITPLLASPPAR
jgi:nicotinamidase-related amidase